MTTSSSDRNRCTRISPSAVLDDRLDGKDLEWARDHLRRCESCRDRVEDFREMMLRVGRLPSAPIGAAAMDEAYQMAVPEAARAGATPRRSFELEPAAIEAAALLPAIDLPPPALRPEITNVRDLLGDLEREIFRDEPAQDHPTPLPPAVESLSPAVTEPPDQLAMLDARQPEPAEAAGSEPDPWEHGEPAEPEFAVAPMPEVLASDLRAVPLDSHRGMADVPAIDEPVVATHEAGYAAEPVESPETAPAPGPRKADTAMRVAVGLGAAACVLLAAVLYEGGLLPHARKASAIVPRTTSSIVAQPTASSPPPASVAPSVPAAPVLFTLGNGVTGGTLYRIRPGTAVAGYTRLVFDIRGHGLPSMVITRPDPLHIVVTFAGTSGASVPVNGIRSYQVAGVEPAVQQGPDLAITIDLARADRVTAFTLPASGAYSPRLVVDLHTS
jgi:hypothetical protein